MLNLSLFFINYAFQKFQNKENIKNIIRIEANKIKFK